MRASLLLLAALLATGANAQQTTQQPDECPRDSCCDYTQTPVDCNCQPLSSTSCRVIGELIPIDGQQTQCSEFRGLPVDIAGSWCVLPGETIETANDPGDDECGPNTPTTIPCTIGGTTPWNPTLAVITCVDSVFANGAQVTTCVVSGKFGNAPILECVAITLFPTNGNLPVQYVQCRGGIKLLEPEQCGANGLQSMNVPQTCTGGPLVPMDDEGLCVGNPAPTPDFDFFCPNNNCIDQFCRGEILKISEFCFDSKIFIYFEVNR